MGFFKSNNAGRLFGELFGEIKDGFANKNDKVRDEQKKDSLYQSDDTSGHIETKRKTKAQKPQGQKSLRFYVIEYRNWAQELSNAKSIAESHSCFEEYQKNATLFRDYRVYGNVSKFYYGSEKIYDNLKKVIVFTERIRSDEDGRDVAVEGYNSYMFFAVLNIKKLSEIIENRDTAPVKVSREAFVSEILSDNYVGQQDYTAFLAYIEQTLNFLENRANKKIKDSAAVVKIQKKYNQDRAKVQALLKIKNTLDEKEQGLKQTNKELLEKIKEWDELYRTIKSTVTAELTERYNFKTHPELLEKSAEQLKVMYEEFVEEISPLTEKYHN